MLVRFKTELQDEGAFPLLARRCTFHTVAGISQAVSH